MVDDSPSAQRNLRDSPWWWLLLIVLAAIVGLLVIAPKYAEREGRIERNFRAREEVARRRAAGEQNVPEFVELPTQRIVPIWTLLALLLAVASVLGGALMVSRRRERQ